MGITSTNFHMDDKTRVFVSEAMRCAVKFGEQSYLPDLTIFLPDGVDAQPIIDAFNAEMEAAKPKQVAA